MRLTSAAFSRRNTIVAITGAGAVLAALVGAPAHAFVAPPPNGTQLLYGTGTLALCVGAQQGADGYIYAEGITPQGTLNPNGMDLIPSNFTQLLAGSGGLDCRAYPADPGSYQIMTYKYPQAPCIPDKTRPTNPAQGTTPAGECLAKVHHFHIIHMNGAVTGVDTSGNPSLNGEAFSLSPATPFADGGFTPVCWTNVTTNLANGAVQSCGAGDGHDYGLEYTTELVSGSLPEDSVIDAQQVTVQVRAGETTEVITHLPDHETAECFPAFDPDVNGNSPVCN